MSKRTLLPTKDAKGAYLPQEGPSPVESIPDKDISIDALLKNGLAAIERLMKVIWLDISSGEPKRDTVQNLKDVMGMLHELKKKEQEILEELSDEDLEKIAR